jgi:neuroligin
LFKRAIIQSGSAFASWALVNNPMVYTRQLASAVNCSSTLTQGTSDILRCLKQKSWEELLSADIVAPKYFSAFGPVIDGRSFLPSAQTLADGSRSVTKEKDFEALQLTRGRGSFGSIALLAGVMRSEGLVFLNQSQLENGLSDTSRRQTLRTYIQNVFRYQRQSIFDIVDNHYTDWEQSHDSGVSRDEVAELLGDGQYVAPVTQLLRQHAGQPASTYAYVLGYPARYDRYPRWATASHGDDVPYLLGSPLADTRDPLVTSFTPTERLISEIVMTYWTNFISSGYMSVYG